MARKKRIAPMDMWLNQKVRYKHRWAGREHDVLNRTWSPPFKKMRKVK